MFHQLGLQDQWISYTGIVKFHHATNHLKPKPKPKILTLPNQFTESNRPRCNKQKLLLTFSSLAFRSSSMTCCTWLSCDVTLSNCQQINNKHDDVNFSHKTVHTFYSCLDAFHHVAAKRLAISMSFSLATPCPYKCLQIFTHKFTKFMYIFKFFGVNNPHNSLQQDVQLLPLGKQSISIVLWSVHNAIHGNLAFLRIVLCYTENF